MSENNSSYIPLALLCYNDYYNTRNTFLHSVYQYRTLKIKKSSKNISVKEMEKIVRINEIFTLLLVTVYIYRLGVIYISVQVNFKLRHSYVNMKSIFCPYSHMSKWKFDLWPQKFTCPSWPFQTLHWFCQTLYTSCMSTFFLSDPLEI